MARRNQGFGLGILLLVYNLFSSGFIPPVTLLAIAGQTLLFLGIVNPPWDKYDVCLSAEAILNRKSYSRLFLSAIEHSDDIHLYYNMASLLVKGRSLEQMYGPRRFLILLLVLTAASSSMYVALSYGATEFFRDYSYMRTCAIGFSGVLFALKVVTTYYSRASHTFVHGLMMPSQYAVWAELILIHVLVPRASFVGHLAGILAGLLYVKGPLRWVVDMMDGVISFGTDRGFSSTSHTYTRRQQYFRGHGTASRNTGFDSRNDQTDYDVHHSRDDNTSRHNYDSTSPTTAPSYGWNVGGPSGQGSGEQHGPSMEELRRRRSERFH